MDRDLEHRHAEPAAAAGRGLAVDVLGTGTQVATVEAVEPISYHGIPGFAERLLLRLEDGSAVHGLTVNGGVPSFADPRILRVRSETVSRPR